MCVDGALILRADNRPIARTCRDAVLGAQSARARGGVMRAAEEAARDTGTLLVLERERGRTAYRMLDQRRHRARVRPAPHGGWIARVYYRRSHEHTGTIHQQQDCVTVEDQLIVHGRSATGDDQRQHGLQPTIARASASISCFQREGQDAIIAALHDRPILVSECSGKGSPVIVSAHPLHVYLCRGWPERRQSSRRNGSHAVIDSRMANRGVRERRAQHGAGGARFDHWVLCSGSGARLVTRRHDLEGRLTADVSRGRTMAPFRRNAPRIRVVTSRSARDRRCCSLVGSRVPAPGHRRSDQPGETGSKWRIVHYGLRCRHPRRDSVVVEEARAPMPFAWATGRSRYIVTMPRDMCRGLRRTAWIRCDGTESTRRRRGYTQMMDGFAASRTFTVETLDHTSAHSTGGCRESQG